VKKTAVVFAVIIFSMAIFLPLTFNVGTANAQTSNYTIQTVTHNVQILNSGHIVISDTIVLSGQSPSSFQIGFPYTYAQSVLEGVAYDSTGKELPIALGVELQDQAGFYGASVDLTGTSSQTFTVAFTFANDLLTAVGTGFSFDFPAYPSLVQTASQCATNIVLPSDTSIVGIDKPDGIVNATSYSTSNLAAFTYAPATCTFTQINNAVQLIDINSLNSQVTFGPTGEITRVDNYNLTCKQLSSSFFSFNIPTTATNIVIRDQFGRELSFNTLNLISGARIANATFLLQLSKNLSTLVTLSYDLPKFTGSAGEVSTTMFTATNYYIQNAQVTYVLPEGGHFTSPASSSQGYSLDRGVFQQSLTVAKTGISLIDANIPSESTIQFSYEYNYLWIAFRPSLWAAAIVAVGIVVLALVKRPKAKAKAGQVAPRTAISRVAAGAPLSNEQVQQFIDTYEEKNKVTQEIRTLEARAEHGRIPRRRYKVQRKTLETRLEALSNKAAELKVGLRSTGGSYADIVRQLDAAEVELNEVEMSIKNVGIRHETGDLSLENYRKQLADLERRKEKAETTVNGLLLRLRGEIR
jgi:hypothetical protein